MKIFTDQLGNREGEGGIHRVGRVLRYFSSRRNWDSPNPSPAGECAPSLWFRGEGHTGERGGGRVPIPTTRGHTLWYSIYVCTLWGYYSASPTPFYSRLLDIFLKTTWTVFPPPQRFASWCSRNNITREGRLLDIFLKTTWTVFPPPQRFASWCSRNNSTREGLFL